MYMPNFSFLAKIERELCEEQIQKKKNEQKTTFLGLQQGEMGLKSQDPPKDTPRVPI